MSHKANITTPAAAMPLLRFGYHMNTINCRELAKLDSFFLSHSDYLIGKSLISLNACGHNARLTCRHFDISPQTFYRWKRGYNARHLESLEDRSHRPKHLRQPSYTAELVEAVLRMREDNPGWGKYKLVPLSGEDGYEVSVSMVGRVLRGSESAEF